MIDTLNDWVVLICVRNQIENQRNLKCNMHNNCVYFNNEGKINGENVRNDDSSSLNCCCSSRYWSPNNTNFML